MSKQPIASTMADQQYLSWGRYPRSLPAQITQIAWPGDLSVMAEATAPLLAYNHGRSYGDCCLNEGGHLLDVRGLDHILAFDVEQGIMRCESGVSLADILSVSVPRGWFLPVTPGTKYVGIGGAIANDVHGKNHHIAGTFGNHVLQFALLRSSGELFNCSPTENTGLFRATIGGLGLTGVILWADIQLLRIRSAYLLVQTIPFQGIAEFLELSAASEEEGFPYTVAWLDCLSENQRGIFYRANHEPGGNQEVREHPRIQLSREWPEWVISRPTMRALNAAYFWSHKAGSRKPTRVHYDPFFYPLDSVGNWNLAYGRRGLLQYQCVVPTKESAILLAILKRISQAGAASFLAVIKQFGSIASPGLLSFPRPGVTIALDLQNRGDASLRLLRGLDELVLEAGGAVYPAKDSCMSKATFAASYPRLGEFLAYRDPKMSSSFWRRVHRED